MALIESKYINTLFSALSQYGSRGNAALWEMLKVELNALDKNYSANSLLKTVNELACATMSNSLMKSQQAGVENINNDMLYAQYGYAKSGTSTDNRWINDFVNTLLSNDDVESELYIEALNKGGMSGGYFHFGTWKQDMLPALTERCLQLEEGLTFRQEHQAEELIFIGDIHGQSQKLDALLTHMSWCEENEKLVFVGDLIDNHLGSNTDHLRLLNRVKELVESKKAFCLLGNHEFNAIGWYLQKSDGSYCRDRSKASNIKQHQQFIEQIGEDTAQHKAWIEWFKSLPLFLNFGDVTAIHACWHSESLAKLRPYLNQDNSLKAQYWLNAFDKNHELYQLIETLLKGPETPLPEGHYFLDKNGVKRHDIRIAWWKNQSEIQNYRDLAVIDEAQRQQIPDVALKSGTLNYNIEPLFPVVIGHYTLAPSRFPEKLNNKVVCVDFNAAKQDFPLVGFYLSCAGWYDDPCELIETSGFNFVGQLIANRVVSGGLSVILNNMLESTPATINNAQFEQHVAHILFTQWDPIGVYDPEYSDEQLSGEYSGYERDVIRLAQAGQLQVLSCYLLLAERLYIGVEKHDAEYRCAKVADLLITQWNKQITQAQATQEEREATVVETIVPEAIVPETVETDVQSDRAMLEKMQINLSMLSEPEKKFYNRFKLAFKQKGHHNLAQFLLDWEPKLSGKLLGISNAEIYAGLHEKIQQQLTQLSRLTEQEIANNLTQVQLIRVDKMFELSTFQVGKIVNADLDHFLTCHDEREVDIIKSRFGLDGFVLQTLEEIGARFQVTRERIRQVEAKLISEFKESLSLSTNVIRKNIVENLSHDFKTLYPALTPRFSSDKGLFLFMEQVCEAHRGELKALVYPDFSFSLLEEWFIDNLPPMDISQGTQLLVEGYGCSQQQALNALHHGNSSNKINLTEQGIYPTNLSKAIATTVGALHFPEGAHYSEIHALINEKGFSRSEFPLNRMDNGIQDAVDNGYIYQIGVGSYCHSQYFNIDEAAISQLLDVVKARIQKNSSKGEQEMHLKMRVYDREPELQVHDYFSIRHIVRCYGERIGVYFAGKSGADTVSLDENVSPVGQLQTLLDWITLSDSPKNREQIAKVIRSGSLNHASFYINELVESGQLVRIDPTHYTTPEKAFLNVQTDAIVEIAAPILQDAKRPVDISVIADECNIRLHQTKPKAWYLSLLRHSSQDAQLGWHFYHNLVSLTAINRLSIHSVVRDAIKITQNTEQLMLAVKQRIKIDDEGLIKTAIKIAKQQ